MPEANSDAAPKPENPIYDQMVKDTDLDPLSLDAWTRADQPEKREAHVEPPKTVEIRALGHVVEQPPKKTAAKKATARKEGT